MSVREREKSRNSTRTSYKNKKKSNRKRKSMRNKRQTEEKSAREVKCCVNMRE